MRRRDVSLDRDELSGLEQGHLLQGTIKATVGSVNIRSSARRAGHARDVIVADDDVWWCLPQRRCPMCRSCPRRARPTGCEASQAAEATGLDMYQIVTAGQCAACGYID